MSEHWIVCPILGHTTLLNFNECWARVLDKEIKNSVLNKSVYGTFPHRIIPTSFPSPQGSPPPKKFFYSGKSTKAFMHPPPPSAQWTKELFFALKQPETDLTLFFLHNFQTERAIFQETCYRLSDFRPSTKTHYNNTLILIFGYVVLKKYI